MCAGDAHRLHRCDSGAPGLVSRCRTTSAEWHIMSLSTPPPCSLPLPEPRHVRAAVLLGGAREVRTAGRRRAARPEQLRARPRPAARRAGSRGSRAAMPTRFTSATHAASPRRRCAPAASRRRCPLSVALAALDRVDDLLDVLDARVVRAAEPDRVDRGIGDHVGDRRVRLRVADVELARAAPPPTRRSSAFGLQTPSTSASRTPRQRLHVEARVEAAADEADAEPLRVASSLAVIARSYASLHDVVADAELLERGWRAAVVHSGIADVADVLQVLRRPSRSRRSRTPSGRGSD